jgi:glucuronate isomerase
MDRDQWRDTVMALPVFDTHTHLNMPGVPIPAQTFWDIAHYFWFQQELWSVGYPWKAEGMPEEDRIAAFVEAFAATRTTAWGRIVRQMFVDLYEVEVTDAASVREADERIRARAQEPDWAQRVVERINVRSIAVNSLRDADFPELPGVGVAVPPWDAYSDWVERIQYAEDPQAAGQAAERAAAEAVVQLAAQGVRGMRLDAAPFEQGGRATVQQEALPADGRDRLSVGAFLVHALMRALSAQGMFAQFFLGIERDVTSKTAMAVNDPRRIIDLYPLFERHACDVELVIGAPQNNLDAVQAARIYPNVYLGGLWWYNFRSSTYRQAMQYRLEAVPARKCALVASDARCIEWCYGKLLLVKRLLADFLFEQVELGWLDLQDARWVAREWLHDAAARRYLE